ncbi:MULTISPECIES: DcaP family trimeric outer membrane transporter [Hydrocarboniphaga]|uniref:DcaP family trimeric outer membrane transporter n=1 Tax=Hydrocarboniphaga TaxID=243627 RepID=UPI00058D625B|nr:MULTISPECIES: DcaP family trimeric outer membrane transporter [Hydrocarboniphaga]MDZ4077368.1 DcaP family trimeric outer membrane transporter [Hydrocarboniphaga sp.]
MKHRTGAAALVTMLLGCGSAWAGEVQYGATSFTWSGYAKLDVLFSRFSEGEVAQGVGRDFYVPATIPVSAGGGKAYEAFDTHVKESRLVLRTATPLSTGEVVSTHLELDFIVNQGAANEQITNAYNPGLRRYFVTYGNWLLGQEWTTFMNLDNVPDTLDFVCYASEGAVLGRQPMVRYGGARWAVALENTETSLLTPAAAPATAGTGDGVLPDLASNIRFKVGRANLMLAGLLRQLRIDNAASAAGPAVRSSAVGGGASLSGRIGLGAADDIRFVLSAGTGLGRYVALGTVADAVLDDGELKAIPLLAGMFAYRHPWNPQWRSTVMLSQFDADNDTALTGTNVTRRVRSATVNLLYSPFSRLTLGMEYRHAQRELEDGRDGQLDRVQFSSRYSF